MEGSERSSRRSGASQSRSFGDHGKARDSLGERSRGTRSQVDPCFYLGSAQDVRNLTIPCPTLLRASPFSGLSGVSGHFLLSVWRWGARTYALRTSCCAWPRQSGLTGGVLDPQPQCSQTRSHRCLSLLSTTTVLTQGNQVSQVPQPLGSATAVQSGFTGASSDARFSYLHVPRPLLSSGCPQQTSGPFTFNGNKPFRQGNLKAYL